MNSTSDTIDAEIDELLGDFDVWCRCESRECQRSVNYEQAKAKLKSLLLRERENELTKFHDVIWPFEPHEPCPYCMGESYSVEHSYYNDRLAELSRLSREESHE